MSISLTIAGRAEKYNRIEKVADACGRIIGVRRLKPSQQLAVEEMAGQLIGVTTIQADDGKFIEVPRRMPLVMAASVASINEIPYAFPRNRAELNAVLDALDDEGLAAVMEGMAKLAEGETPPQNLQQVRDAAKKE